MEARLVDFLMRWRNWLALLSIVICSLLAVGMQKLYFQSSYKAWFAEDDPQRVAHESQMEEYARSEDEIILLSFSGSPVFSRENLATLQRATEMAWNMPLATRVDSLINYQYSRASEDELIVSDFIESPQTLNDATLAKLERIAQAERQLAKRLIASDGKTTALFVSLMMPPEPEPGMDEVEANARILEMNAAFASIAKFARQMRKDLQAIDPNVQMYTVGNPTISQTFTELGEHDLTTLVPMMFLAILVSLAVFLRSLVALVGVVLLIALSTVAAMGFGGLIGYKLNLLTISAPTAILTLAVCDAVHLLMIYLRGLSSGQSPEHAMREALLVNMQPIALTSITTAVGFLTLNFSFSPVFAQFGNITAVGVMMAMLLSLCLLPAVSIKLVRSSRLRTYDNSMFTRYANFISTHRARVLTATLLAAIAIIALVPLNNVNDDPTQYFDRDIEYRQAADFSDQRLPGIRDLSFSLNCGAPGCVNDPAFLSAADEFVQWAEGQEFVESVFSFSDVLKRINRNMHGDDPAWYQVPDSEALAAQYL
ncbi:MAG: MMPL family transporter, partial [Pseudomonadales bacterium]|nr:MMPL family transporter [Pseudomonadales bacterium]